MSSIHMDVENIKWTNLKPKNPHKSFMLRALLTSKSMCV